MTTGRIAPVFISHGSPMMAIQASPASDHLDRWFDHRPLPLGIVVMSAHWHTRGPNVAISTHPSPPTVHDFGGFPDRLYRVAYPARTDADWVNRVTILLKDHGFTVEASPNRGYDHGVWVPLIRMRPQADIPIIQLSMPAGASEKTLLEIGRAVATLSDQSILVLGSGSLTHNHGALQPGHASAPDWVSLFCDWVSTAIHRQSLDQLLNWAKLAPYSEKNHPTPEHFLPLFFAMGAGDLSKATRVHHSVEHGVLAMDCWEF